MKRIRDLDEAVRALLGLRLAVDVSLHLEVGTRDGRLIVIVIASASASDFATFEPTVEALLNTIRFPSPSAISLAAIADAGRSQTTCRRLPC